MRQWNRSWIRPKDKQLVPAEWIEQATSKQVSSGSDPNRDWDQGYGFQFWRCRHDAFRGDGKDGQFCIVLPRQDAVISTERKQLAEMLSRNFWKAMIAGPSVSAMGRLA